MFFGGFHGSGLGLGPFAALAFALAMLAIAVGIVDILDVIERRKYGK